MRKSNKFDRVIASETSGGADRNGATLTLVIGENELAGGVVTLKDMTTGPEQALPRAEPIPPPSPGGWQDAKAAEAGADGALLMV